MLENLMLASKFDNSCPQFAEGTSIRFSKSLEYVYYSLLLLFTQKKRLIEPKDLNNRDSTWNKVLVAMVGWQAPPKTIDILIKIIYICYSYK